MLYVYSKNDYAHINAYMSILNEEIQLGKRQRISNVIKAAKESQVISKSLDDKIEPLIDKVINVINKGTLSNDDDITKFMENIPKETDINDSSNDFSTKSSNELTEKQIYSLALKILSKHYINDSANAVKSILEIMNES